MTTVPPHASGIYQIRCIPTGKIYVGSAVDLYARWGNHRWRLRRGTHHNCRLQAAWDKYGEHSFAFNILELVDENALLAAEQTWIDKTQCTDRTKGFNIFPLAGSPGDTQAQVWEGFIDPDGNAVTITNLFAFCREHGLNPVSMYRLARGTSKLKSAKGGPIATAFASGTIPRPTSASSRPMAALSAPSPTSPRFAGSMVWRQLTCWQLRMVEYAVIAAGRTIREGGNSRKFIWASSARMGTRQRLPISLPSAGNTG